MTSLKSSEVIHLVRKGDLAANRPPSWDDPDGIATLTAQKRDALVENPLSTSESDPVQIVATRDGVVAGKLELISGFVHVDERRVPVLWSSGYLVPERFRGSLIGVRILLELHRLSATVGACGVSQSALPVVRRLKWREFVMPRYLLVLRSRQVVERYVGENLAGRAASGVVDVLLRGHKRVWEEITERRSDGIRAEPVDRMPEDLDAVMARHLESGRVAPHRSAAWLNWLLTHSFSDDPSFRSALFLVVGEDDTTLGYFAVKCRFYPVGSQHQIRNLTLGSLQDWMIFDEARLTLSQVLLLAARELERWRPDVIELCVADAEAGARLRRWGFPRAGDLRLVVRASRGSPLLDERFATSEAWRLRPAEADNFFS